MFLAENSNYLQQMLDRLYDAMKLMKLKFNLSKYWKINLTEENGMNNSNITNEKLEYI